jgi:ribosomal protein S18 acetylase RimI-like enzyme
MAEDVDPHAHDASAPPRGRVGAYGRPGATDVAIRAMLEPDLLAYKALRDAMLAGHPEAFTSDAETESQRDLSSYRSRLAGGSNGGTLFTLVALDGGRVIGALTCEREPRHKVQHLAHLVGMMVADTHRGHGIGRALLMHAVARLRGTDGLAQITLSVTAGNRAAVGLYESVGFTRYGRLPDAIRLPAAASWTRI